MFKEDIVIKKVPNKAVKPKNKKAVKPKKNIDKIIDGIKKGK
jgi:hypothetical protein